MIKDKINWCINLHRERNCKYDGQEYKVHLDDVAFTAKYFLNPYWFDQSGMPDLPIEIITLACYAHDLIEDCGVTYNDVKNKLGVTVAEIVRAVTSDIRGRSRKERMTEEVYKDIRETHGAMFVKLCDRIANVEYSKKTGSSMFKKYQKENEEFLEKINADKYPQMKLYLQKLFEND